MRVLFFLLLVVNFLCAKSFYFHEQRYSAALEKTLEFDGTISFGRDNLKIEYKNRDEQIDFSDEEVHIIQAGKSLELPEEQSLKMVLFFETLLDIYHQRDRKLTKRFHIQKDQGVISFIPLKEMQEYMKKIELQKNVNRVASIKFFLQNGDTIKIKIEHEIQ